MVVIVAIVATAAVVVVSSPVPVSGLAVPKAGDFSTQASRRILPLGRLLPYMPLKVQRMRTYCMSLERGKRCR